MAEEECKIVHPGGRRSFRRGGIRGREFCTFGHALAVGDQQREPACERCCTGGEKRYPRPHQRLHHVLRPRRKERVHARLTWLTFTIGTNGSLELAQSPSLSHIG